MQRSKKNSVAEIINSIARHNQAKLEPSEFRRFVRKGEKVVRELQRSRRRGGRCNRAVAEFLAEFLLHRGREDRKTS